MILPRGHLTTRTPQEALGGVALGPPCRMLDVGTPEQQSPARASRQAGATLTGCHLTLVAMGVSDPSEGPLGEGLRDVTSVTQGLTPILPAGGTG